MGREGRQAGRKTLFACVCGLRVCVGVGECVSVWCVVMGVGRMCVQGGRVTLLVGWHRRAAKDV